MLKFLILSGLIPIILLVQQEVVIYSGIVITPQPDLNGWTQLNEGYYRYSGMKLAAGYLDYVVFSKGEEVLRYRFIAEWPTHLKFKNIYLGLSEKFGKETSNDDYTLEMIRKKENLDIDHTLWSKRVAESPSYYREWIIENNIAIELRWRDGDGSPITVTFTLPNENL